MKSILSTIVILATSVVWEPVLAEVPLVNNRSSPPVRHTASDLATHNCVDEPYGLSLVILGEIIALSAEPKCEGYIRNNRCQRCPSLLFHSDKGEGACSEKRVEEFSQKDSMDHEEAVDLGLFGLGALIDAFDAAPTDSETSKLYGFSEDQNCAGLLLNMFVELGMNPTGTEVGTFVSRHLSKKSP